MLPWSIPANTLDTFFISYPASRYRSALIGICVHSVQTLVFTGLLLRLVLRRPGMPSTVTRPG